MVDKPWIGVCNFFLYFQIWDKSFFRLYSNGELQEFAIIDNLVRILLLYSSFTTESLTGDRTRDLLIVISTPFNHSVTRPRIHLWISAKSLLQNTHLHLLSYYYYSQADKENIKNTLLLQDFIRMLDGRREIGETLCFGVKTLRSIIYFRTLTRVDYENWWKEFSSFVAAPVIKRTQSKSLGFLLQIHF